MDEYFVRNNVGLLKLFTIRSWETEKKYSPLKINTWNQRKI